MTRRIPVTIIILAFLAVVLLAWEFLFKPKSEEGQVSPTPITLPVVTTMPTPAGETAKDRAIKLMPLLTKNYTIQYLPNQDKFLVIILNNPFEEYQQEVKDWFVSLGIDPSSVNITWASSRGVAPGVGTSSTP